MTVRAVVAALLGALLLSGCGLAMPSGPQPAGEVRAGREEPPPLQVIPAGPQRGATPEDVVRGFLDAQISPEGDYEIAREFLAPGTDWDPAAGALVYRTRRFVERSATTFRYRFATAARISDRGSFTLASGDTTAEYEVAQLPSGEFRLTGVPPGLYVDAEDRQLSFAPYPVYFHPRVGSGAARRPLVADRVFVPLTQEPATALVRAVLTGPTPALTGVVEPALPVSVDPADVRVTLADQVVTVDLPEQVGALPARDRQRLAAQLVWTLVPTEAEGSTSVVGVRLRAGGEELRVRGSDVQTPRTWSEYDPAGIAPDAPAYFVAKRQLRSLAPGLPQSAATDGDVGVDEVAASPRGSSLALLTRSDDGLDVLRVGPVSGPFGEPVLRRPELASPSWGPGDQGLWVLERGPRPEVWLVPPAGAAGEPQRVVYEQPAGAGPLSALRVSRDGARIALVYGTGASARLFVGVVVPSGGLPRIAAPVQVAPSLLDVADVAWTSSTTLSVLAARDPAAPGRPVAGRVVASQVSVDGSTEPSLRQTPGELREIAAAPGRPTVLSVRLADGVDRVFVDEGEVFTERQPGSAPAYPG